jgi:hypothetical protein
LHQRGERTQIGIIHESVAQAVSEEAENMRSLHRP